VPLAVAAMPLPIGLNTHLYVPLTGALTTLYVPTTALAGSVIVLTDNLANLLGNVGFGGIPLAALLLVTLRCAAAFRTALTGAVTVLKGCLTGYVAALITPPAALKGRLATFPIVLRLLVDGLMY
jgi:hypothetical protein